MLEEINWVTVAEIALGVMGGGFGLFMAFATITIMTNGFGTWR